MKQQVYVCGDACFIRSDQKGLWHKTDRCVAFVSCPSCRAYIGELCGHPTGKQGRQTHHQRRHLYTSIQKGKERNENILQITVEDEVEGESFKDVTITRKTGAYSEGKHPWNPSGPIHDDGPSPDEKDEADCTGFCPLARACPENIAQRAMQAQVSGEAEVGASIESLTDEGGGSDIGPEILAKHLGPARMEDAVNRLAKFVDEGEDLSQNDPPTFLHKVADEIRSLRAELSSIRAQFVTLDIRPVPTGLLKEDEDD